MCNLGYSVCGGRGWYVLYVGGRGKDVDKDEGKKHQFRGRLESFPFI